MNHISHSKDCQKSYPKEDFTNLKLKCEERGKFLKKIQNQETKITNKIERKAKETILDKEEEAKSIERYNTKLEKSQRKENKNWFEFIETELQSIKWKNCTDEVSNSFKQIETEAEDLFQECEQMIDDAVTQTKDSMDWRSNMNKFIGVRPDGLLPDFTIRKKWRKFKIEVGERLVNIALTVNQTFEFTHKIPELCMWK